MLYHNMHVFTNLVNFSHNMYYIHILMGLLGRTFSPHLSHFALSPNFLHSSLSSFGFAGKVEQVGLNSLPGWLESVCDIHKIK